MTAAGGGSHAIHVPSARIFWVLWVVVTAWLIACAFLVKGEYGDGYLTIANSRHFFSDNPLYWLQRGPLASIVLAPVEWLVQLLDIGPFEVTPYHLYSAILHSTYLYGCWWALRRTGASALARIMAFATAVTSVVFFGFAPYLSHDIIPGLLFLMMIFVANRWLDENSWRDALLLVVIGASVVLIKQTFAIFWAIVVAYAALAMLLRWDAGRVNWRKLGLLFAFAAISGSVAYVGYALSTAQDWGHMPWYARPWALAVSVTEQYGLKADRVFPADLYLRNLHNFGILAVLLVVPGVVIALRGINARLRMIAVCWVLGAVITQLVTFREVRYLLFLAPLTAMLVAPVIDRLLRSRAWLIAMVLVVAVDQVRGFSVAAYQLTATASVDPVRFFESAGRGGRVVASEAISFIYDAKSPLIHDSYHGIYHISARVIFGLQENAAVVYEVDDIRKLGMSGIEGGDRVYVANQLVRRFSPYAPDNSPNSYRDYIAIAGRAENVTLRRRGGEFFVDGYEGSHVMLVPDPSVGPALPLLSASTFKVNDLETAFGSLDGRDSLDVIGVIADAICRADICRYR